MDQDTTKGSDKRNWRERLGIGSSSVTASGSKELPRISDAYPAETKAAPISRATPQRVNTATRPASAVRPAPMAPRAAARPVTAPSVSPERLAERLHAQREASTKLAEQRVQAAKQRADIAARQTAPVSAPVATPPKPAAPVVARPTMPESKPKFTFAEDTPVASQPARPAIGKPATPPPAMPQLAPARPPLGAGNPGFPPRQPSPQAPAYGVPPQQQPYGGGYPQQPPAYRPIEPGTGYTSQPYASPPGYTQRPYGQPAVGMQRPGTNPNYQTTQGYGAQPGGYSNELRSDPRFARTSIRPAAAPAGAYDDADGDGLFDEPAQRQRRPGAGEYQAAYREAEGGYEEEAPRSVKPWVLLGLLLLALTVAGVGVWYYNTQLKPLMTNAPATAENVPVVEPPAQADKVQPEQPAPDAANTAAASKKQIYDRIVGDQEILGGDLVPTEEVPSAPADGSAEIPEPIGTGAAEGLAPLGDDAAPLPIPPPPGDTNTQGSLEQEPAKQSAETITPAAGESQAAVAAPVPGDGLAETKAAMATETDDSVVADEETIAPVIKKKVAVVDKPKKPVAKKDEKKLGSKPVVLVAPAKKAKALAIEDDTQVATIDDGGNDQGGGLYGGQELSAPVAQGTVANVAPVKKKKTLADLFNGSAQEPAVQAANVDDVDTATAQQAPVAPVVKAKPLLAPKPAQQTASAGGYVVQLASFKSKVEATTEYSRMKAKHGAALQGLSPIVSEAQVGGSTRYRLSVGTLGSSDQAKAVCGKLFAAGERDCLVRRQ